MVVEVKQGSQYKMWLTSLEILQTLCEIRLSTLIDGWSQIDERWR